MDANLIKGSLASIAAIKERIVAIEQVLTALVITAPTVRTLRKGTAADAGLSDEDCLHIVLGKIRSDGGESQMRVLYHSIESLMNTKGWTLSFQGRASARRLVNETAVHKGYIEAHDPQSPGWRITPRGKAFLRREN